MSAKAQPPPNDPAWMAAVSAAASSASPVALTEDSLARVFAHRYRDALRYCHHHGSWFHWIDGYWRKEETKLAFCWSREICREFNLDDNRTIARTSTAAGVERFAQSDRAFAVTSEIWDRDKFLLGTPGGTVDLRSGELRPPEQEDFITKRTAVTPAPPGAEPLLWLEFLRQATQGDEDLILFLRQMVGYALTGDTREHVLFFVYGDGGTGKGTFVNTVHTVLGDYAVTAPMETFTTSNSERHPTDLAMLRGARLVTAQETESGRAWAEAKVKALTGGDRISARFMRQDFFTYTPEFKLVFTGNHRPVLRNVDNAARRRFRIVPFEYKPPEPDLRLPDKLLPEHPAILRWAIDGCLDWQENGLITPEVVTEATNQYFDNQDVLGQWLFEKCKFGDPSIYFETHARLYKSWSAYADAAGDPAGSSRAFGDVLEKRGFIRDRTNVAKVIRGLALKPEVVTE